MTTVLGTYVVADPVSAKKNALKSEISEVLKLIDDKPRVVSTPKIIERSKSEQEKDYISERVDLMIGDLDKLKIKADHIMKKPTAESVA